jgi:hypothetical protein
VLPALALDVVPEPVHRTDHPGRRDHEVHPVRRQRAEIDHDNAGLAIAANLPASTVVTVSPGAATVLHPIVLTHT